MLLSLIHFALHWEPILLASSIIVERERESESAPRPSPMNRVKRKREEDTVLIGFGFGFDSGVEVRWAASGELSCRGKSSLGLMSRN